MSTWAGTPGAGTPPGKYPLGQVHPAAGTPPRAGTSRGQVPPWAGTPWQVHPPAGTPPNPQPHTPGAVHGGRYRQQAGGTHPTEMHSC